jgi:hypothetical protein
MLSKRHRKRRHYHVFAVAEQAEELLLLQQLLREQADAKLLHGANSHYQTFEVCIAPVTFRRILESLPQNVYVSYEETHEVCAHRETKKPEKC